MAPAKQSVDSGMHHPEQQVAAGPTAGPASLSQASALGWLPPALLPPKADTSGKQKHSKKIMKQKASTAGGGGRVRGAPTGGVPQPSAGGSRWDTAVGDAPRADSWTSAAMPDVGKSVSTAKSLSHMTGPHSLDSMHADDSPPQVANGHAGRHSRTDSEGSGESGMTLMTSLALLSVLCVFGPVLVSGKGAEAEQACLLCSWQHGTCCCGPHIQQPQAFPYS